MAPPKTVMNLFSLTDIGRRLTDPEPAYEALQMIFGWQTITGTAAPPGPLASMAVNVVYGPPVGTGNSLSVLLPFALAGRTLTIINLSASTLDVSTQTYNPATATPDHLTYSAGALPLAIGSVNTFLAYEPGFWVLNTISTSAPALAPPEG